LETRISQKTRGDLRLLSVHPRLRVWQQDGRSYQPQLFKEAASILGNIEQVDDFLNFLSDVILTSTEVEKENNFYADVPDEFLDPLMATIMRDPVILPSSLQTVDR